MVNAGLVLEGGGMRGVYTSGVLEYFMEQELYFQYNIGVSAGACNAVSYLSRQKGRNRTVNIDFIKHPSYLSFRNYFKNRQLFGMDFIFDKIPNVIVPFDFDAFNKINETFVVGTTDCHTGRAVYYNNREHGRDLLKILRASSSLPFIAPMVSYDEKDLLDGGISEPIPIKKAEEEGFSRNVVILTQHQGYQKKPTPNLWISRRAYKNYPNLLEKFSNRSSYYNETLEYIENQKKDGNVFVIQPSNPLKVGRIERNQKRLTDLYNEGYEDGRRMYPQLLQWLEKC